MKLKIIILITFIQVLKAQTYQKDWEALYKKAENGSEIKTSELENIIKVYKKDLSKFPDNSTQLYSLLANNYYNAGSFAEAEKGYLESYRYAQSAADTSLKHIVELSLAILCYNANRLIEAEVYYVKCLPGMASVYGQTSREYTQLFYDYTRLLIDLGKYQQAAPYVDALLYYYKTLDGEENLRYQALLNCKAIVYQNTGDYASAVEIMRNIAEDKTILKLGDTLGHVITVSNLGDLYREMGRYDEAISQLKNSKRLFYQYNIDKSPETIATICNNLALCYKATGDYREAEQNYNLAIELYQKNSLTNTEPYCSTLSNKADLYRVLGRNGEASGLLITALQIRRERFGTQTENYANALSNLANVYFDVNMYDLALEKNLEAKTIYEQTVGENHQSYANCLNSLSLCYLYLKNYQLAVDYKVKAIDIVEKTVGKSHYRYSAFLISTYGLYRKTGQLSLAEKNIREALKLVEKKFGRNHELYAHGNLALAEINSIKGNFEEAGTLYMESLNYYASQVNDYFDAMGEEDQSGFLATISQAFDSYNLFLINYKLSVSGKDLSFHLKSCLKFQLLLKSLLASRSAMIAREIESGNDLELKSAYKEWIALKTILINKQKTVSGANED
ncbi:MAG: tetratricopeptide repeat protein, partial [Bacteroidia bacterium]|nr:tetratricopeptide repeat protein [Bacteroidia bacterium]